VHVDEEQQSKHMAILNQGADAISRTGKMAQRQHDIGNGPEGIGDVAFLAALRIFQHSYLLVIRIF
jgi:hypothetical protein